MNVTKAAQFVTKVMAKANSMPKWAKVGSAILGAGAIFGGGMLAEKSIIGDRFEKINERLDALEKSSPNSENVKAAETPTVKKKAKNMSDFPSISHKVSQSV